VPDDGAGGVRAKMDVANPAVSGSNGPGTKIPAAIRADILQDVFHAGTAERAFKRTDHCAGGIGWKRRVAVLTGGSQFEHDGWCFDFRWSRGGDWILRPGTAHRVGRN
jgi:hypothetical protein